MAQRTAVGQQGRRRRSRSRAVVAAVAALAVLGASCSDDRSGGWASVPTDPTSPADTTVPGAGTTTPATVDTTEPAPVTTSTTMPVPPGIELPPPVQNSDGSNDALSGVGRLTGQGSDCTAFLVDTGAAAGAAFALTNGHCVGLFDSTSVIVDGPGGGTVAFNRFVDTDDVEVGVASVRWATMRGTDLAVLELERTLGELRDAGIAAYALGPFALERTGIRVVGVPVTGVPSDEWFVRAADCAAGTTTRLLEFVWVWDVAQANDCDAIVGGNSGSPVFDASGVVVGIINTTTVAATPGGECHLGHPCELADGQLRIVADTSYAMPVDTIAGCFTATGEFDVTACAIEAEPPPATLVLARPQQQSPATWDLDIDTSSAADGFATVSGPIASTDCRDAGAYAPVTGGVVDPPAPEGEGFFVTCLAPVLAAGVDVGSASYVVLQIDDTPPVVAPQLFVAEFGDERTAEPVFATPELSDFQLKAGPTAEIDCDDPAGYVRYRRIPLRIGAEELPAAVCVIGFDLADNAGPPARFEIE